MNQRQAGRESLSQSDAREVARKPVRTLHQTLSDLGLAGRCPLLVDRRGFRPLRESVGAPLAPSAA